MIQAKELRIGNYLDSAGVLTKVVDIQRDLFYTEDDGINFKSTWCVINPIPLTEEWLVKFGFEKGYSKDESNRVEGWVKDGFYLGGNYEIYYSDGCAIAFEVHQLQNLYHALTGEELTINE